MPDKERRRIAIIGLAFALILNILLGVCVYLFLRSASLMLLLAIICGFIIILMPAPELVKDETVLVIVGLTVGFGMAFGLGIDLARKELSSELPLNKITIGEKGKDAETDVTARIIRSGERGVLYFDPELGQFGLVPWDSIKRIDWARSPLIGKTL